MKNLFWLNKEEQEPQSNNNVLFVTDNSDTNGKVERRDNRIYF